MHTFVCVYSFHMHLLLLQLDFPTAAYYYVYIFKRSSAESYDETL